MPGSQYGRRSRLLFFLAEPFLECQPEARQPPDQGCRQHFVSVFWCPSNGDCWIIHIQLRPSFRSFRLAPHSGEASMRTPGKEGRRTRLLPGSIG